MMKLHSVLSFVVCGCLSWTGKVHADTVTDWNAIAVQALTTTTPPRPGPLVFLDLAIVQAAVHDAVQATDRRFKPYHTTISGATGSPPPSPALRTTSSSTSSRARRPPLTRPIMSTWPPAASRRMTRE
jgi:hypothetical protein